MSKYNFSCVSPNHHSLQPPPAPHQNSCFLNSPFTRGKKMKKKKISVSDKTKCNTTFSASRRDHVIAFEFAANELTPGGFKPSSLSL